MSRLIKIASLATLTSQNSLLTVLLHYSRVNAVPSETFSAPSAVLMTELLKLAASLVMATVLATQHASRGRVRLPSDPEDADDAISEKRLSADEASTTLWMPALAAVWRGVLRKDCWKLGIPATLYVIQNNLQFVAAANLDVPTFQVTYNLKILTAALFSVILLKRRLSSKKWIALCMLALGVAIVQLQSTSPGASGVPKYAGGEMNRAKGLVAVLSACFTSGFAGVWFEVVLKGSTTDIWIRNVQLSLFSLVPALFPILLPRLSYAWSSDPEAIPPQAVLAFFGGWAWSVVACQVVGGLVTALYADNLLKGFATALAIVLSAITGFFLFSFQLTPAFLVGTTLVVSATVLYAQPDARAPAAVRDHLPKRRLSDASTWTGTAAGSAVRRAPQPGNVTPDLSSVSIDFPDVLHGQAPRL